MKYLLFCLMNLCFGGCSIPKLSMIRKDINSNLIKTQGFYYNRPEFQHFLLYNHGVILGDYSANSKNIDSVQNYWSNRELYKYNYDLAYSWGLFEIIKDSIRIEHWEAREWGVYRTTKYNGILLNDSTLLLNHPVVGRDTFYFHYLPIKPDSTNKFIK